MSTGRPLLSIVIPAYNEAGGIEDVVKRLQTVLNGLDRETELLVVDDSSPDGTAEICRRLQEHHPGLHLLPGRGISSAIHSQRRRWCLSHLINLI